MSGMWNKQFCRCLVAIALMGFFSVGTLAFAGQTEDKKQDQPRRGRKYTPPPPTTHVEITVLRDTTGKPIPNAGVVFHLKEEKGNMELKTDPDGKVSIDVLPTGSKVLVQVIAKGFQTYGGDYVLDAPQKTIEIRMKRPTEQYSIYKNHDQGSTQPQGGEEKKPDPQGQDPKADAQPQ
jgi:Carboxypeptidase regulatory-like domain